jgi:phosphoribosylaminoimidazolecarboxamide formyltransferase / IMP cyclohydrolase
MKKRIRSALISVYYKDGLESLAKVLADLGIKIYSTGGTLEHLKKLGLSVTPVENITGFPSILGGRVKTLHPAVFGGILGRRNDDTDISQMEEYGIPAIDLVIVDLYPFEETVASTTDEKQIIEKIDIGGPSMIRAAAKNYSDVVTLASKSDYPVFEKLITEQNGETTIAQRKELASRAFEIVKQYDIAISNYFNQQKSQPASQATALRYGENPHQQAMFRGDLTQLFTQLNGKELSYNNLVDVDASIQLIREFNEPTFAIIKHTNVCGIACRPDVEAAWKAALAGDPESAFGGVLITNAMVNAATANEINEIFFEVLIAPAFEKQAVDILSSKKNRIILQQKSFPSNEEQYRSVLNGTLIQSTDKGIVSKWEEAGGRNAEEAEKEDLIFANIVCKHLKSNAIALARNKQLIGKGCGQTSRIDSLRQALDKAKQSGFDIKGAVMASDAFFPFNDCVKLGHEAGIDAFIQPGGSIRDKDSIDYCKDNQLVMVITGMRHFKH